MTVSINSFFKTLVATPVPFCRSRCGRHRHCLSSLLLWSKHFATMVTWRHTSLFYCTCFWLKWNLLENNHLDNYMCCVSLHCSSGERISINYYANGKNYIQRYKVQKFIFNLKTGTGADRILISLSESSSTCRSKALAVPRHCSISVGKIRSWFSDIWKKKNQTACFYANNTTCGLNWYTYNCTSLCSYEANVTAWTYTAGA